MNVLQGRLISVVSTEHTSLLSVESCFQTPFNVLLAEKSLHNMGDTLKLVFKESEVILSKSHVQTTANIQDAEIVQIKKGSILTKITLSYQETQIVAIVPTMSFDLLEIGVGERVFWIIQPSEISLMGENYGS